MDRREGHSATVVDRSGTSRGIVHKESKEVERETKEGKVNSEKPTGLQENSEEVKRETPRDKKEMEKERAKDRQEVATHLEDHISKVTAQNPGLE